MIELDGSFEEGGGSLVRVALALSTLTGQEFRVVNIRSNRAESGLKAQHLASIKALQEISAAKTNEIALGSAELWFKPGRIKKGSYTFDIGTAGSISLFLQAIILPSLFINGKITFIIKGGTCGMWQASADYFQNVFFPQLHRFVQKIELKVLKRGYFPIGGGEVQVDISPRLSFDECLTPDNINYFYSAFTQKIAAKTAKIELFEQGQLEQIRGIVNLSSELEENKVGERIKNSAENILKKYNVPINIRIEYSHTPSIGGEIMLYALFSTKNENEKKTLERKIDYDNPLILGSDALLEKNKSSEEIGKEAGKKLILEIESQEAVDPHLADQLIPFMALLPGSIIKTREITKHTSTNIYVVEKFLPVSFRKEGNIISVTSSGKDL